MSHRSTHPWKSAGIVVVLGAVAAAAWHFVALRLVSRLIDSAYHEQSFGFLNGLFEGRSIHPVTRYLDVWHQFASQLTVGLLGLTILIAAILSPVFQRFVDRVSPLAAAAPGAGFAGMTGKRRLAVLLLILVLPGIQVMETVLRAEHWPFSFYSMYSSAQTNTMSWMRVYGVTESGDEIFLQPDIYLRPFDIVRLPYGFEDVVLLRENADQSAKKALANCLELYERNRRNGLHHGPPLKGLRLYKVEWKLQPDAANKNVPDTRELLNAYPSGL
jgi:hypothetical protein